MNKKIPTEVMPNTLLNNTLIQNTSMDSDVPNSSNRVVCYLGLGSNLSNELGSPTEHILTAVERIKQHPQIYHVRHSALYASKPVGPQDQPDFINAVVELSTTLSPQALLKLCQDLEQQARRIRKRHWGERSLDVDILLYGDADIDEPNLTIPHREISHRNFVLVPLYELNPEVTIADKVISDYALSQDWQGLTKI